MDTAVHASCIIDRFSICCLLLTHIQMVQIDLTSSVNRRDVCLDLQTSPASKTSFMCSKGFRNRTTKSFIYWVSGFICSEKSPYGLQLTNNSYFSCAVWMCACMSATVSELSGSYHCYVARDVTGVGDVSTSVGSICPHWAHAPQQYTHAHKHSIRYQLLNYSVVTKSSNQILSHAVQLNINAPETVTCTDSEEPGQIWGRRLGKKFAVEWKMT